MQDEQSLLVIGGKTGIGRQVVKDAIISGKYDTVIGTSEFQTDVRDRDQLHEIIRRQPWTHVVYNAGVAHLEWLSDMDSYEEFKNVFDVNVFGFIRVIGQIASMRPQCKSVVATVSDAHRIPMRGSLAYCSSKAALAMAIKVAARELAPTCRVNGVAPAMVADTPMTDWIDRTIPGFRGWTSGEALEYELRGIPMGRRATVQEVSELIHSVLDGPGFMTGSIVEMTGGR